MVTSGHETRRAFDVEQVRADFPGLSQQVHGKPLVYLDNAATTQKPRRVIDAVSKALRDDCANVHRGVHLLSERATRDFEQARVTIARHLGGDPGEVVLTKGATESINLVAWSFAGAFLKAGDEVLISGMEHHANIVPWQMLAQRQGIVLKVVPITDRGELDLEAMERLIGPRTKLISVVWISNALGTVNPVRRVVELAQGIPVLIDGSQALPHVPIDVKALGCDFLACSGHKAYGPTGVGILWGKKDRLASMPPYQGGGDMIASVTFEKTTYREPPARFEAGTPNIAGVIGLGAALEYMGSIDLAGARAHEDAIVQYAVERLSELPGLRLIGTPKKRAGAISFSMGEIHPHDIGTILDREGVAIRTGHHCTQPLMARFELPATARASFAFYNTRAEVDALVRGLEKVREVLG